MFMPRLPWARLTRSRSPLRSALRFCLRFQRLQKRVLTASTYRYGGGLVAAAGTRRGVIESLNRALNDALASDEVRTRLALEGADPEPGTPRDYAALIDHELTMWSDLVKAAGIRPE